MLKSDSDFGCFKFFISSRSSMVLHSTATAVPTVICVELNLRSCGYTEWFSLSQISGLIPVVPRVSQLAGHRYFADLSFSFESSNFLYHRFLIKSASCFSAARPNLSALRRSYAIFENNGSLPSSLCSSRARGLSLEVLTSVPKRAGSSTSESSQSSSEPSKTLISSLELYSCRLGLN